MVPTHAQLSEISEDYLEAILELSLEGVARVRDIASKLGVTRATASGAVKRLRQKELVKPGHYDYIELTEMGENIAKRVYERHVALYEFLHRTLELDEITSQEDACRLEHALSGKTLDRLLDLKAFFENDENASRAWKDHPGKSHHKF